MSGKGAWCQPASRPGNHRPNAFSSRRPGNHDGRVSEQEFENDRVVQEYYRKLRAGTGKTR